MDAKLASIQDIKGKTFDYIIIGGGTAGCVLANRLTENPNISVVVLEAGKARFGDPLITTPNGWMRQIGNPDYDWAFSIKDQARAKNAKYLPWIRGKGLGGSSNINATMYTKPGRKEMDAIEALGNPGWNWDSFQKYANKVEKFTECNDPLSDEGFRTPFNPESIGHSGPLTLSYIPTGCGAEVIWQQTLSKSGVPISEDSLGGDIVGMSKGITTFNPTTMSRADAATSYLLPAMERSNLKVMTEAYVCHITTEKTADAVFARGVEFEYGGKRYSVFAGREVILSAGALKSPQLLELSGIGDLKVLEPLGIKPIIDLPGVGTNVQDRILCNAPVYRMKDDRGFVSANMLMIPEIAASLREKHNLTHDYLLVVNSYGYVPLQNISSRTQALVDKKKAQLAKPDYPESLRNVHEMQLKMVEDEGSPDVELVLTPLHTRQFPDPSKPHLTLVCCLSHPWSRGTVHISTTDPKAHPLIDPNYFEDDLDMDIMLDGLKACKKIAETEPFKDAVDALYFPDASYDLSSDEKIKELISENIWTMWHTCGSVSMLPKEAGGVVDPQLKVYGTKNLRVVDLSVLPLLISAHTQAYVYAMAEQAADIIKSCWA